MDHAVHLHHLGPSWIDRNHFILDQNVDNFSRGVVTGHVVGQQAQLGLVVISPLGRGWRLLKIPVGVVPLGRST